MAEITRSQRSASIFLVVLLFARNGSWAELIDHVACKSTCGTRPPGGFGIPYEQAMTEDGRALELSSVYGTGALYSGPTSTAGRYTTWQSQGDPASTLLSEDALGGTRNGIAAQRARGGGLDGSNVTACDDNDICWDCCSNDGGATCRIPCTFVDSVTGRAVNLEFQCITTYGGECLTHYCCRVT